MKEFAIRPTTEKALERLNELHKAKKLFNKDGSIRDDPDVQRLVRNAIREFGLDVKREAGLQETVGISGEILYNMMEVVFTCGPCVCHVGAHDWGSGRSYYLGYYYPRACA
jgi:hypothetical protein